MLPHTTSQAVQATLFHNTTDLTETEIKDARIRAKGQNDLVLQYFIKHRGLKFTPIQIWAALSKDNNQILLTSVRRAITTLTSMKLLEKFRNVKKKEIYGDSNCTWSLNQDYEQYLQLQGNGRKKKEE